MKKFFWIPVLAMLIAGLNPGLFAQSVNQSVPQPAFRLLDGYLTKREYDAAYGAKVGPWVLAGTGALLAAGSATVWFAGDALSRSANGSDMDPTVKVATAASLAGGAVLLTGIGVALGFFPPVIDERAQYAAIYKETDPTLQETMAVARLKGLAEDGKTGRIVGGWTNLGLVGASVAFQVIANNEEGRPWSKNLLGSSGWVAGWVLGGVTSLLVRSPEEALYDEYLYIIAQAPSR